MLNGSSLSQRESKFPTPGEEEDSLKGILSDPKLLQSYIKSITQQELSKEIKREMSKSRVEFFKFFDDIMNETKDKIQEHKLKLDESEKERREMQAKVTGISDVVVELQIGSNKMSEKIERLTEKLSEEKKFDQADIDKIINENMQNLVKDKVNQEIEAKKEIFFAAVPQKKLSEDNMESENFMVELDMVRGQITSIQTSNRENIDQLQKTINELKETYTLDISKLNESFKILENKSHENTTKHFKELENRIILIQNDLNAKSAQFESLNAINRNVSIFTGSLDNMNSR